MSTMSNRSIFTKEPVIILVAVICTLLWGSAFPCLKIGYELFALATNDIPGKLVFAGVRFTFAGLVTIAAGSLVSRRLLLPDRKNIRGIILLGFVQTFLEYLFFCIGVANTTGVKSSILNSVSSFFAVILAHFCYKNDRITPKKVAGCILGFIGVVLITLSGGSFGAGFNFTGDGFVIIAAISFSVGFVISKNVSANGDSVMISGWQLMIGGVGLLAVGLAFGGSLNVVTAEGIGLLVYLVILSALAFGGWTILLKYNPVAKISIYNFLTPVFGALLSAVFLHEIFFTFQNLAALFCVCAGIYVVNHQKAVPFTDRS
ncbi:DMT family transporter [Anaerotruncus rubiinfantis]|uniref:DMT family transporter n=1 Tax=Anaerotruncus rubiinfantis TaxID=1720200 RepID=UPI001FAC4E1A|nr:DMT family transporter [Anaerotruncus rubiinfantis]